MPHTQPKLKQNKLSSTWDIMSLNKKWSSEIQHLCGFPSPCYVVWVQIEYKNVESKRDILFKNSLVYQCILQFHQL